MEKDHSTVVTTVDIGRLEDGNHSELAKLLDAAQNDGIFYLDFSDSRFRHVLDLVDEIFALSSQLFAMSGEEKMRYDVDRLSKLKTNGYKPVGRNHGGISTMSACEAALMDVGIKGDRDGFESYVIPGKTPLGHSLACPALIATHRSTLSAFCSCVQRILGLVLSCLSSSLDLPPKMDLASLHRSDASSTDILRLLHYMAQPSMETGIPQAAHTDLGSLTLLFSNTPGLQARLRQNADWTFVDPQPQYAVVNLGDGLKMLSGGLLAPCLHRVSPLANESMQERYSIAYLQRADDDVEMRSVLRMHDTEAVAKDEIFTSQQWLEKKFGILRRITPQSRLQDGTAN